jgi:hypothetical protein
MFLNASSLIPARGITNKKTSSCTCSQKLFHFQRMFLGPYFYLRAEIKTLYHMDTRWVEYIGTGGGSQLPKSAF